MARIGQMEVKKRNLHLFADEAAIGTDEFSEFNKTAMRTLEADDEGERKELSQPTRDENFDALLDDIPDVDTLVRQTKILKKLGNRATPVCYKWEGETETDGLLRVQGNFYARSDDSLEFDPALLPPLP